MDSLANHIKRLAKAIHIVDAHDNLIPADSEEGQRMVARLEAIECWNEALKYRNGDGVPQDDFKARELIIHAAELGLVEAQYEMGRMLMKGESIARDAREAARWYRLAAEQGSAWAQQFRVVNSKHQTVGLSPSKRVQENKMKLKLSAVFLTLVAACQVNMSHAQNNTATTIQDVKVGMPRTAVLSGLAKKYDLRRIGDSEPDEPSTWLVIGKDPNTFEQAEIYFSRGTVFGIYIYLFPPMKGEAVKLVQRLFFLLRDNAPADPGTEKMVKADPSLAPILGNQWHITIPVDLFYKRSDKLESMEIDLKIGEKHFSIEASKVEGFPEDVEIKKVTDSLLEMVEKNLLPQK